MVGIQHYPTLSRPGVRRIDSSEHLAKYHDCEIVASIVSITTKSANPGTGANITPRFDKFARTWYT